MKKVLLGSGLLIVVAFLLFHTMGNKEITAATRVSVNDSLPQITTNKKLRPLALRIDSLYSVLQKRNGFNCSMLVAHDGEILVQKGYGYADYKGRKMIDSHTAFQLASVSKPITGTAMLMLYDEGKVQLTDLVSKYIDGFPYPDITIEMLLCHRSGLPNYMYFCDTYVKDKSKIVTNDDVINIIKIYKPPLAHKPGTHFMYSNTNFCLLASIIAKVSGKTYSEFLHERIFDPLGMKDSYIVTDSATHSNTAKAYTYGFVPLPEDYLNGVVGDKGIYSSVLDLYRFHLALQNGTLLKKETLEMAYQPRSNEKRGEKNYGYGWRMHCPKNAEKIIYHNGWWHGFNNLFYRRFSDSTVVIILSNKLNKAVYNINSLLQILNAKQGSFDNNDDDGVTSAKVGEPGNSSP